MSKMHLIKTMSLTSLGGLVLAGVLVFAISEYDEYYDWLMIKQSLLLGLGIGLIVGLGIADYQSEDSRLKAFTSFSSAILKNRSAITPETGNQVKTKKQISIWQMLWRGGLAGILGLLIGVAGGLWFCAEQYSGLSNSAQGWLIFYVPYYAVILIFFAGLGLALGTIAGIVWGYFAS